MKGNPFTRGLFRAESLVGRKKEIALFEAGIEPMLRQGRGGIALTGVRGMGKTSLMRKFAEIAARNRILTAFVRVRFGETGSELMKKILRSMANEALEKIALGTLPEKLARFFENFRDSLRNKDVSPKQFAVEWKILYDKIKNSENGAIIFLDNIDESRNPDKTAWMLAQAFLTMKKAEVPVALVCSSTTYYSKFEGLCEELKVNELNDAEVREGINAALKESRIKMGDECLHSITADSQGNPRVLFNVCWTIYDMLGEKEKVIAKWHYLSHFASIMNNLSRDLFDEIYYRASENEREILKKMALLGGEANVSTIATEMKKKLNTITTLVMRLHQSGSIVKIERGRYRLFNRLYGRYLLEYV